MKSSTESMAAPQESMATPQDLSEEIRSKSHVRRRRRSRKMRQHELKKKIRRVVFVVAQAILIALAIYIWTRIAV